MRSSDASAGAGRPQQPAPFRDRVYQVVRSIPAGRLMTYGQVALLCGLPRAAQAVGWTLHTAPGDVPCQRVVNRHGGLADGYTGGGPQLQRIELESEGVEVRADDTVDLPRYQWWPPLAQVESLRLPPEVVERIAGLIDSMGEHARLVRRRAPGGGPR